MFDLAGRVFKNKPAPDNLAVPPHKYVTDTHDPDRRRQAREPERDGRSSQKQQDTIMAEPRSTAGRAMSNGC